MPHKHTRFLLSVLTGTAALSLAACSIPNSMPRGYVYHKETYKSPNPPESSKFTELQRSTMGPEQANQFRMALYDLVQQLTARAGIPPKSVYVNKPSPMTPFYATVDNDLRESLRHSGYRLSDSPADAYVFAYSVEVLTPQSGVTATPPRMNDGPAASAAPGPVAARGPALAHDGQPNVRITLHVFDSLGDQAKRLTHQSGEYHIRGAETLVVPFAFFPGTLIPEPTGPGENFRE